jgi:uroporphyrinogen III methyltransferase / synthase
MQSSMKHTGIVYLVGAGPGDPGLITARGVELLKSADVVVYDALANPHLLRHCGTSTEKIYVGKRAASHSMTQEQINSLLVAQGGAPGRRVVRLKGGDPFVFGRGGEECEALVAAGIPFEIVPGVTAAIAATAYAGIPVTHRDLNSSFTFLTGHEKEEEHRDVQASARGAGAGSDVNWSAIARLPCIAFYMGVKSLPRISQKLIENGMRPDMPAAAIQWGTTPRQRTIVGTIATLPDLAAEAKLTAPALTIVGEVVTLREKLNWFERRPLFGPTIVVTRTRQQASDLTDRLTALGAKVIEAPTIELVAAADPHAFPKALAEEPWDWIIFTSANSVTFTKERLLTNGMDVRAFGDARIAAIGDATAAAVHDQMALVVDLVPTQSMAEALADTLVAGDAIRGKRFLIPRAEIGRPVLIERLTAGGAALVRDVAIYETRAAASLPPELLEALESNSVQWITFASSSAARNFCALLGADYASKLAAVHCASIGPVTTETLKELSLPPAVEAPQSSVAALVEAIVTAVSSPAFQ